MLTVRRKHAVIMIAAEPKSEPQQVGAQRLAKGLKTPTA